MKLLAIYSTDQLLGGGEISFTISLKLVQQSGWDVLALIPGSGPLLQHLQKREIPCAFAFQGPIRRGVALRYLFHTRADWLELAQEYRPNLIHCNAVRSALYGQSVGHRLGIPIVLHARKSESDPIIDHFLMLRLNAIICTSEVVRRRFPHWLGQKKLKVLYNPVDLAQFEQVPAESEVIRKEWLHDGKGQLVGIIGRLSPIKGQHLIVQGAPEILRHVPETRFVFVGSEDPFYSGYEAELRRNVNHMGLQNRFLFAGPRDEIVSAYHALDLVAFPTTSEGFGRVIIEAGAARKPLVTSDIEVVREVLSPELHDLTVPCGQAKPLAHRIIDLLQNEALRKETADRLHRHVRRHFGLDKHRDQLLTIYRELIS